MKSKAGLETLTPPGLQGGRTEGGGWEGAPPGVLPREQPPCWSHGLAPTPLPPVCLSSQDNTGKLQLGLGLGAPLAGTAI